MGPSSTPHESPVVARLSRPMMILAAVSGSAAVTIAVLGVIVLGR